VVLVEFFIGYSPPSSHLGPYKWYRSHGHRFNHGLTSFGVKNGSNCVQSFRGKPPFFDGVSSFAHWKRKMTMYLGSIHERVLQVTENDFAIIDPDHLIDEDRANRTCNRMALNTLYNGIDTKVFEASRI
jgi:hypothetical protein